MLRGCKLNCVNVEQTVTLHVMKENEHFNLEEIKKKALEQFFPGKSFYGKDGAYEIAMQCLHPPA